MTDEAVTWFGRLELFAKSGGDPIATYTYRVKVENDLHPASLSTGSIGDLHYRNELSQEAELGVIYERRFIVRRKLTPPETTDHAVITEGDSFVEVEISDWQGAIIDLLTHEMTKTIEGEA